MFRPFGSNDGVLHQGSEAVIELDRGRLSPEGFCIQVMERQAWLGPEG